MTGDPRRLALAGWALVIVVAILMLVVRGSQEAGPAIIFAVAAVVVGVWIWRRSSRPAWILSLVLGGLLLLMFSAYTVADLVSDDLRWSIFVTDLIGVAAGLAIVVGSINGLRRRHVATSSATL